MLLSIARSAPGSLRWWMPRQERRGDCFLPGLWATGSPHGGPGLASAASGKIASHARLVNTIVKMR